MEMNLPLFKDDNGVYVMGPLGCKIYCEEVQPGIYKVQGGGNYFAACASALTVAIQQSANGVQPGYWKLKKPIIDGVMYDNHVPLDFWQGTPGGILTTTIIASVNELKSKLGSLYTAWTQDGKVWVKHKPSGNKQAFDSYDDASQWVS
jgi:hypothetical protein